MPDCVRMELLLSLISSSVTFPVTSGKVREDEREGPVCLVSFGSKRVVFMGKASLSTGQTCLGRGSYQSMILFFLLPKRSISSSCLARMRDFSQQRMVGFAPGISQVQSERMRNKYNETRAYKVQPIRQKIQPKRDSGLTVTLDKSQQAIR